MYTPHTVSLINLHNGIPFLVFLRGVMLQALNGQSVQRRGDQEETIATLYVPLYVNAINPSGEKVSFLPPLEYARCADPEKHWTLQPENESAGRCSFFVKGEIPEACSLAEAREKLHIARMSKAELNAYYRHLDNVVILRDNIDTARNEGIIEGRAEGRAEQSRDMALKMKARGFDVATIADLTGLTEKEIETL